MMQQAGLRVQAHRPFVFGGANLYVGVVEN